ncbi:hypothetical protein SAMD00019534_034780 [Acytostelium subglobosum LB1]|uniref:hypothetical protein n=1 Tax=Acytostelium subglobosum LB1 TaxID=1410327 RepID=UPI000644EC4D|nr:hypothetical protein SAMD00019534_034780 [Acytostelium subglobosum LB1]GAM20303.1 hypothetical protein SAMD00019534_034780 [Acytostelium subglobosum LB1]|eukprot:XP_012759824.1 hypothetical protein SAMD00019534_034780 [Acytostelium subglobosum LB1]
MSSDKTFYAYVGTYSPNGEGIYLYSVDPKTGLLLKRESVVCSVTSPAQMVIDAQSKTLFAASEVDNYKSGKNGCIVALSIDQSTGSLTQLNELDSLGTWPCHLSLNPKESLLLVANYGSGSVAVFPIDPATRQLQPSSAFFEAKDNVGPTKAVGAQPGSFSNSGHDAPHAHWFGTDPSGQYAFSTDLGQDRIYQWKLSDAGALAPNTPAFIDGPSAGCGPRHLVFHCNGKFVYMLNEESSAVTLYHFDQSTGLLQQRQTLSTFEPSYRGSSFGSGIILSQCGRFVYAANRLRNTVTLFSVEQTEGTLTFVEEVWTRGDFPRSIVIDPLGNHLYVLNQRSDNITIFTVDKSTGRLSFIDRYIDVGSPSQMVFASI